MCYEAGMKEVLEGLSIEEKIERIADALDYLREAVEKLEENQSIGGK